MLPEYAAALAAIAELDKYLDAIESADRVLAEQQRERELMSPEGATFGSVHRRDRSRKSSRQHVMTMADVDALGNLLLVGEQAPVASPAPASGTATPKTPGLTPEAHARFIDGVRGSQEALKAHGLPSPRPAIPIPRTDSTSAVRPPPLLRSGSTAGSVNINGVKLTPADLLKIDEVQRVAILNRVKDGEMTIEDALSQVVENKQQQQCVIS